MTERTMWRIAWPTFAAAAVLSIVGVVLAKTTEVTWWAPWLYIAALWLLAPAAWYGLMRFTRGFKAESDRG